MMRTVDNERSAEAPDPPTTSLHSRLPSSFWWLKISTCASCADLHVDFARPGLGFRAYWASRNVAVQAWGAPALEAVSLSSPPISAAASIAWLSRHHGDG
jgi:hypothetical protein